MSEVEAATTHLCSQTGLMLSQVGNRSIFRVARKEHGPFNPKSRTTETPIDELSRWDTPGRTIYGGDTEQGALVEVLSYVTPDDSTVKTMSAYFDDVDSADELFLHDQVAKELSSHGGMGTRSLSRGWREDRNLYEFAVSEPGWFVDVTASASVGALDEQLRSELASNHEIDELNVSHLTADGSTARAVTTRIARWVRGRILDDGSYPVGIRYPSKYGIDLTNYAIWLRRGDDGTGPVLHPLKVIDNYALNLHTEYLHTALDRLRIRAH